MTNEDRETLESRAKWLVTTMIANAGMVTLAGDQGREYVIRTIAQALDAAEERGCRWGIEAAAVEAEGRFAGDSRRQLNDTTAFKCAVSIRALDPAAVVAERCKK